MITLFLACLCGARGRAQGQTRGHGWRSERGGACSGGIDAGKDGAVTGSSGGPYLHKLRSELVLRRIADIQGGLRRLVRLQVAQHRNCRIARRGRFRRRRSASLILQGGKKPLLTSTNRRGTLDLLRRHGDRARGTCSDKGRLRAEGTLGPLRGRRQTIGHRASRLPPAGALSCAFIARYACAMSRRRISIRGSKGREKWSKRKRPCV